jgi:ribosomal RNA assembly protein
MEPFKAVEIVSAIGKGFSPERAYRLLGEEEVLQLIDLRDYAGKSPNSLSRIKGRIIGEAGKSRKTIEDLSGTYISVYGHTVAIIGTFEEIKLATEAVTMLSKGRSHANVYNMLQEAKRKSKLDRMQLWENDTMRKL